MTDRHLRITTAWALALLVAILSGCASAKLAAIRAARRAVDEAREALADPERRAELAEDAIGALDRADEHLADAEEEEAAEPFVDADTPAAESNGGER